MKMYTQCLLASGTARQVSWIPAEAAIRGKQVRLKGLPWTVLEAWQVREWDEVNSQSQAFRRVHTDSVKA
jgi:hypothetical protein